MTVPLEARDVCIGAMTFVRGDQDFEETDLALAVEIARRGIGDIVRLEPRIPHPEAVAEMLGGIIGGFIEVPGAVPLVKRLEIDFTRQ